MKRLLTILAVLLPISAIGLIFVGVSGRDLHTRSPMDSVTMSLVPTPECERKDFSAPRTRTLQESLPAGSKIIESTKIPGGIKVVLANGLCISARGASVTARGISFKGPYEIKDPMGGALTSEDVGSVCLLARDGSFKLIPAPGGTTSLSTPLKIEDTEQSCRSPQYVSPAEK